MGQFLPEVRGVFKLIEQHKKDLKQFRTKTMGLRKFLDRVYYELRNLGQTSSERAINYSATEIA